VPANRRSPNKLPLSLFDWKSLVTKGIEAFKCCPVSMLFSEDTDSTLSVESKTLATSASSVLPNYERSCIGLHSYTFRSSRSSCRPASCSCCGPHRHCQGLESSLEWDRFLFLARPVRARTSRYRQAHMNDWFASGCTS